MLGQIDIVILEKYHPVRYIRPVGEVGHLLDHLLPSDICRMSLGGHQELNRPIMIGQNTDQLLLVPEEKICALVGGCPSGKAYGEGIGVQDMPCGLDLLRRGSVLLHLPGVTPASIID